MAKKILGEIFFWLIQLEIPRFNENFEKKFPLKKMRFFSSSKNLFMGLSYVKSNSKNILPLVIFGSDPILRPPPKWGKIPVGQII